MRIFISVLLFGLCFSASAQNKEQPQKPRLVVAIVVDQMRNDFLLRYWDRFGNGGFRRLVNEGFYFRNTHYNYIPTYTGPGHASIFTGTTPRFHGIIANDWYIKKENRSTYCTYDEAVSSIGTQTIKGKGSPRNLLSSTIGDEIKLASNGRGKVFAVAIKDRSAILPAGHAADAAFWLDEVSGKFISSTWYLEKAPQWLDDFNKQNLAVTYLKKDWNTLYPIATYSNSITDENNFEEAPTKGKPVFPYDYTSFLEDSNYKILKATPYGNSITKDLALNCLRAEALGKDEDADLLSISFSTPDVITHEYGPRAAEVEDIYLRLDKEIEEILLTLDKEVGKGRYVVMLTADHGGGDVPNHLKTIKIPGGYIWEKQVAGLIKGFLQSNYGDSTLLANVSNEQVFLNEDRIYQHKLRREEMENRLANFLTGIPGIAEAYTSQVLRTGSFPAEDPRTLLQNGYNHKMSGNVCFIYQPNWMDHGPKGTTHGSGYNYDTHIPLLFFGTGIKRGESFEKVTITQIAPTICELLRISQPNSCISAPLNDRLR